MDQDNAILAVDIGGTKTLVALVQGSEIVAEATLATRREDGPDAWLHAVASTAAPWRGQFGCIGFAVTGFVRNGLWSAMNPATLGIPANYPLIAKAEAMFGRPAVACNDAQAAGWGEYAHGTGGGKDLVFLTISTGIGGGIVLNGRLLEGLAGHFGLVAEGDDNLYLEDRVSGRWMAAEANRLGHDVDARLVFEAAAAGESWAQEIVEGAARRVARLCQNIQLTLDPPQIVIGGGIGLAEGFIEKVRSLVVSPGQVAPVPIHRAALGTYAGILGIADLARARSLHVND